MSAGLQDVVETYEIALNVSIGISDRIAHTGLCSKVYHHLWLVLAEEAVDSLLRGDIALDENVFDAFGHQAIYFLEAPLLEADIIIIVHIIDANDGCIIQVLEQALHQVATNEPCRPCHKNSFSIQIDCFHFIFCFLFF